MRRTLPFALVLGLILAACTYDPPPQVSLGGPVDRRYPVGEPIPVLFSEPVVAASLSLAVWPGEKDAYDIEGARLPSTQALVEACTLAASPCGASGDLALSLDDARTTLTLDVAPGFLGKPGRPLFLEIAGTLTDDAGRRANVAQVFPFQIIEPMHGIGDVFPDTTGQDTTGAEAQEPLQVFEGPYLFFAQFQKPPLDLPQQFFADIQVDEATGSFVALMTDSDPIDGADKNTSKPEELFLDTGAEGFVFLVKGRVEREAGGDLVFLGEPFDLALSIGPVTFALIDAVIQGRIEIDEDSGLTRWDGLMSVNQVVLDSGSKQTVYTEANGLKPATFQILELTAEQVPADMPRVCVTDPCPAGVQTCDLPQGMAWPPASICPAD